MKSNIVYKLYLKKPREASIMPAKNVAVKTKERYSRGESIGLATFPNISEKRIEATATLPIAKSFELPITAYTRAGTKFVSA